MYLVPFLLCSKHTHMNCTEMTAAPWVEFSRTNQLLSLSFACSRSLVPHTQHLITKVHIHPKHKHTNTPQQKHTKSIHTYEKTETHTAAVTLLSAEQSEVSVQWLLCLFVLVSFNIQNLSGSLQTEHETASKTQHLTYTQRGSAKALSTFSTVHNNGGYVHKPEDNTFLNRSDS